MDTPESLPGPERVRDVIVIGGSSGAVEVVLALARALPANLPAAVFIVIHRSPDGPSLLAELLNATGPLPACNAEDGQHFETGHIYVAPPDRHLLLAGGHVHVRRGPRENRMRPAVDPLFRSAAASCSTRVIGVILSGNLDDGTAGLLALKRCGGLAVVQDPAEAGSPGMPRSALAHVEIDHILPAARLAALLTELAGTPCPPVVEAPHTIRLEAMIAAQELSFMPERGQFGTLSPLTCPECHGTLSEIDEQSLIRYRCHTGHAYTAESLRAAQDEAWEKALYGALRAQQEQAMLSRHMAQDAKRRGQEHWAKQFEQRAWSYDEGAETIRQLLGRGAEPQKEEG